MTDYTQKIFGFPLTIGLKKKVALKHVHYWWSKGQLDALKPFANTGAGDLINECSGLNSRIVSMQPRYRHVGNGMVLLDIEYVTDRTGCSLVACGVGPAKTKEELEAYRKEILTQYKDEDPWGFAKRYSYENLTINDDGTYEMKDRT